MNFENQKQVKDFWNYPIEKVTDETVKDIKIIVSYRERLLEKVENDEWYLNEYNDFSKVIKKSTIRKFVDFIDIANLVFEMSREDIGNEVEYLISTGFLSKEKSNKFSTHYIAKLIFEIQAKVFSLSNRFSENNNGSTEEKIEYYNSLILEIENEESDYYKMVIDFYESWIEQTFNNEVLKKIILSQKDVFIDKVKKCINQRLNNLNIQLYNNSAIVHYQSKQKELNYNRKVMMNKCWSYYKKS